MKSGFFAFIGGLSLCWLVQPANARVETLKTSHSSSSRMPAADEDGVVRLYKLGPAPRPVGEWPTDPKARKAIRKQRDKFEAGCKAKYMQYEAPEPIAARALEECDALLALPIDPEFRWDARAIWLQHRALHQVIAKGHNSALMSLKEADEIGLSHNDPLFAGGLGIANAMLRSYSNGKMGKREDALAEIERVRRLRPHSTSISRSLDFVEANVSGEADRLINSAYADVKWQPDNMRWLLTIAIAKGDFTRAGDIIDDVSTINPKLIGGWTIEGEKLPIVKLEGDVEVHMQRAYIAKVLKKDKYAVAAIEEAQAMIKAHIGLPPVIEGRRVPPKYKMEEYQTRVMQGERVEQIVKHWQRVIELRSLANAMAPETLMAAIENESLGRAQIAIIDIVRNLKFENPLEKAALDKMIREGEARYERDMIQISAHQWSEMLPDPEHLNSVPNFGKAGDGILFGRENGISRTKEKDSDISTIRFGTTSGSLPIAEELSLLAIAQYAQREGNDSFILLARRSMKRTTTVSGYYSSGYTIDSGYESLARVILLDSNNLPPEWSEKRNRLIMVQEVMNEIKPRYDALYVQKYSSKAKTKN